MCESLLLHNGSINKLSGRGPYPQGAHLLVEGGMCVCVCMCVFMVVVARVCRFKLVTKGFSEKVI